MMFMGTMEMSRQACEKLPILNGGLYNDTAEKWLFLNHFNEQSLCYEADSHSASQEISRLL
jgi:hypothetical protein